MVAKVVNCFGERQLADLLQRYGETRGTSSHPYAKQLIAITERLEGVLFWALRGRRGRIDPATLGFQVLRVFVDRKLEVLEEGIGQALQHPSSVGMFSFGVLL